MNTLTALNTLARYATENINTRPPEVQVEIYEALAQCLPRQKDRVAAERLAFSIQETAKLQLEFSIILTNRESVVTDRLAAAPVVRSLKSKSVTQNKSL